MPPEPKVLLVEDETSILEGLFELFSAQGFDADKAEDGSVAVERLRAQVFDLVVLDLMIPEIDGLTVLKQLRSGELGTQGQQTPVLILTAKGAEEDIVRGLECGADDYVTKPFGIRELVARAKGLVRRSPAVEDKGRADPQTLSLGETIVDHDNLTASWAGGQLALTAREATLLFYLHRFRSRPVPREELLVEVWGYQDGHVRTRTVDVHIQQLRAKLKSIPGAEDWIETVRGRGYRLCLPEGG